MSQEHVTTTVAGLVDANMFDVEAPIEVHYAGTSLTGDPLLSYRDTAHDLHFSGDEITRSDTPVGQLVTVTLDDLPDAFRRTFTLVLPTVRLRLGDEVECPALGVETTDRSGAFVPAPGPAGVLQSHQVHQLTGVARFVEP